MADKVATPPQPNEQAEKDSSEEKGGRSLVFWLIAGIGAVVALFVIALIVAIAAALLGDPGDVANWVGILRDLFIILLAMEGIVMGIALIVLVIQLAALLNILQNEVRPIVDNANETVTTVKGTAQFMSQNLVEPVIKMSAFLAGVGGLLREVMGIRSSLKNAGKAAAESGDKKEA
jgi:amino acid permease